MTGINILFGAASIEEAALIYQFGPSKAPAPERTEQEMIDAWPPETRAYVDRMKAQLSAG